MKKITLFLTFAICAICANAQETTENTCYIYGDFNSWTASADWQMTEQADGTFILQNVTIPQSTATPQNDGGFKIVYNGEYYGFGYKRYSTYATLTSDGWESQGIYTGDQYNLYAAEDIECLSIVFDPNGTGTSDGGTLTVITVTSVTSLSVRVTALPTLLSDDNTAIIATLSCDAIASVEGATIQYILGEDSSTQIYSDDNKPTLTEGMPLTTWVKIGDYESTHKTTYPFVVALAQTDGDAINWAQVGIWAWTSSKTCTTNTTWPGDQLEGLTVGSIIFFSKTFLADSYTADAGYLIGGNSMNVIFNNNGNGSQTSDEGYTVTKIYTCLNQSGADVTDSDGNTVSGVEAVKRGGEAVKIVAGKGEISVSGATSVAVYSISGVLVSQNAHTSLPAGFYIVRADNTTAKVTVR